MTSEDRLKVTLFGGRFQTCVLLLLLCVGSTYTGHAHGKDDQVILEPCGRGESALGRVARHPRAVNRSHKLPVRRPFCSAHVAKPENSLEEPLGCKFRAGLLGALTHAVSVLVIFHNLLDCLA